ncbi:MAG: HlyD family type I secretion periplasmic adaptor subunit [Burkholderiales bacterium]
MSIKHKIEAYGTLLRHYRDVFRHHWRNRNKLDGSMFNEREAEFLPSAISLQEKPVSPAARLVGRVLMALVGGLLVWSIVGKVDIIVNVGGKIVPSGFTKTIGSVDVASVKVLHVEEGQVVKAGDALIDLDTSAFDTEHDKAIDDETEATLQIARSQALILAVDNFVAPKLPKIKGVSEAEWTREQQHLAGQYQEFIASLHRIDGDMRLYAEALPIATKLAQDYQSLAQNHDVSNHAYLEKEQARIEIERKLTDAANQRADLIASTKRQAYDSLTEGEKLASESKQDALKANAHSKLLKLTSPINGTVQQLTVHTIGGVVPAAQPLMLIVPSEKFVTVEGEMENKDVGFVRKGQKAEVKIDAFDYTKYGTIPAHVAHVSHDAIQDDKKGLLYSVEIVLDQPYIMVDGRKIPLIAGMSVNAEIKTGSRRIIEYVLSPVLQQVHESLNER